MASIETEQENPGSLTQRVQVTVNDQPIALDDHTPTGRQILAAAGLRPDTEYALLLWPASGPTREIALEEVIPLHKHGSNVAFLAARADGVAYFVLDDERYAWAGSLDVDSVRRVGRVPAELQVWWERRDEADVLLESGQGVALDGEGVERLYTRRKRWRLDVQGEATEWDHPLVQVREALIKAGIDLTKTWTIVLKVKGQEPRQVELSEIIDLDQPGIERLWLRPRQIENGEGPSARREFAMLPKDETFLAAVHAQWETITDGARRWLIIHDYALPKGYNVATCRLAIEIPQSYPAAQIDMFYCDPPLSLQGGGVPDRADVHQSIAGVSFQRWSRHRQPGNEWSPSRDNVSTHLGLVDEALGREVGA